MKNVDTATGDQLGLFGGEGAVRKPRKEFKAKFLGKTTQHNLIDGLDCLPGQLDLDMTTDPPHSTANAK